MNQPVPIVSDADVDRIVRREFPAAAVAEAAALLGQYGGKPWHREALRVRAAMLKVAGFRNVMIGSHPTLPLTDPANPRCYFYAVR